jgi:hypothetical protein
VGSARRAKKASPGRTRKPRKTPPFGKATRKKALEKYFATAGEVTALNAWTHLYRLLLSVDRRTQLAHVYDSNHMQPGGNWHGRAVRFTELLCQVWGVAQSNLPDLVDVMFRACVDEYLAQQPPWVAATVKQTIQQVVDGAGGFGEVAEEVSEFLLDVTELLVTQLGLSRSPELLAVVAEIERKAEHYFTIEKKRQNVRGEGLEDTLEWLLLHAGVPPEQLVVRTEATGLPGFKKALATERKTKDKVPKPDLAIISPDKKLTLWILTVKWSLRQDRLDIFGQEFAYYREHRLQSAGFDFVLITNEMDLARLRGVLSPPEGGGGFHFHRVYHLNCDLLEQTHGEKFEALAVYRQEGRLLSLSDLLVHVPAAAGG